MKITGTLILMMVVGGANAQPSYDAATIPAQLKENAHVVKRYEDIRFNVKDVDKATYSVHRIYTILDEEGADRLSFREYTERYRKIDEFEIRGYAADGRLIEKYKKKDLQKQAILDGVASDGNVHFIRLAVNKYPATIEYKYEIELSGTAWYPDYEIQEEGESVENSTMTVNVPVNLDLRFKAKYTSLKPVTSVDGSSKKYVWTATNIKAIKDEESQITGGENYPTVLLAPNKFRLYNTYGDMSTWKSFGAWSYQLMQGLDELPEDRKQFFANLVKDAKTDRDKAAIIYNYLQKNFRYVSIQLGIGGWKPFPVKFTDEKKYGDCKGLSFFMYSVLKSVGVKSYPALVQRDYNQEGADLAFPLNRFNHMILCIPQPKDSIWLECTSNTAEFGVLDATTSDKNALLVTENGGVLVPTARGKSTDNIISSTTNIWLLEDGSGKSITNLVTRGAYKEQMMEIAEAKKDDQKMYIVRHLGFQQPDEFSLAQKSKNEFLEVDIDLSMEKIPQFIAGSKMFLNSRLNSIWTLKLPKSENRTKDFYFSCPFIITDTTIFNLPDGFVPEVLPKGGKFKCDYAEYLSSCTYDADKKQVVSTAKLLLHHNRIPASKYAELKNVFDGLMSDGTQKLIVKRN